MSKFPLVIAHRGASSLAPENTLPAFKKAIDMGCDGVELDVQLTKDGEVVVFHDSFLNRTTDGSGFINEHTLSELKTLDAGKHFSKEFKGTKIPTLAEVFKLFEKNNLLIIVELKGKQENLENKVSDLIRSFNFEKRAIVASYNHDYLRNIKRVNSSILTQVDIVWTFEELLKLAKELKVDSVCPIHYFVRRMWKINIMRLKANKLKLFTYTVDTKDDMMRMIKKGVDGIMTDKPQLLLELKAEFFQRKRSLFRKLID
jgi:glycerophosphoryl diester phosphodiesterase